ncbi:hypothetical protein APX70_05360, partial [Pseudomonas syringae pv. maculicola]
ETLLRPETGRTQLYEGMSHSWVFSSDLVRVLVSACDRGVCRTHFETISAMFSSIDVYLLSIPSRHLHICALIGPFMQRRLFLKRVI